MRFLIVLILLSVGAAGCSGVETTEQMQPIEAQDAVIDDLIEVAEVQDALVVDEPASEMAAPPDMFFVGEEQASLLAERALDVQQVGEIQVSVSPDGASQTTTAIFNYQVPGRSGEMAGIGVAASCSLTCYCSGACDCEMDGCQPISGGCSAFGCSGPTCHGHCNYAGAGAGNVMSMMELGIEVEPLPLPFPIGPGPRPIE